MVSQTFNSLATQIGPQVSAWASTIGNSASQFGGYVLWAAQSTSSSLYGVTHWTAFTAAPAIANGTINTVTVLARAIIATPGIIVRQITAVVTAPQTQAVVAISLIFWAREFVDHAEKSDSIKDLPLHVRMTTRFLIGAAIGSCVLSFGLTTHMTYAVALALFAAGNGDARAFVVNAINTIQSGAINTLPIKVRIPEGMSMEEALQGFQVNKYQFSSNVDLTGETIPQRANQFTIRPGRWIDLSEWMFALRAADTNQRAYAYALFAHLVETQGPLEVKKNEHLTIFHSNQTPGFTISVSAE